jgi:hypothetical protein
MSGVLCATNEAGELSTLTEPSCNSLPYGLLCLYYGIYLLYSLLRAMGMYTALIALECLLQVWARVFGILARDYGGNCRG